MVNSWHGDSSAIRGTKVPLPSPCMSSNIEYVISPKCPVIPGSLPGKQSTVVLVEAAAATAGLQLCFSEYYLGSYEKYTLLSPGIHQGLHPESYCYKSLQIFRTLKMPWNLPISPCTLNQVKIPSNPMQHDCYVNGSNTDFYRKTRKELLQIYMVRTQYF